LVQVEPNETETGRSVELPGVRIIWDANLEQMTEYYGRITLDHVKTFWGSRLVAGFDGQTC